MTVNNILDTTLPEHSSLTPQAPESAITKAAFRFWEAKVLLSAVNLGVFDILANEPLDLQTLTFRIGVHSRGARDFFDALVSLGFLTRTGEVYANSECSAKYLNSAEPTYLGGLLNLAETRLYPVWGKLTEALRTGQPQNEAKQVPDYYSNLIQDQSRLRVFLQAMSALSMESARQLARTFPWRDYTKFADLGSAEGGLAVELVKNHRHLLGICFDLPPVQPFFQEYVSRWGAADRLTFCGGDFFRDALPQADVFVMGHVLHNWDLPQKQQLVQKSYDALAHDGVLLIYDAMIDEDRKENTFGLLMSLNMLLVTSGGSLYTASECQRWLENVGFRSIRTERLNATDSAVIGIK
jgi:SAM-dependent methyltransferase